MSPTLQKILMLQRHQVIRWGGPTGYFTFVFGLLFMLVALVGFQVFNSKLKDMESQLQETKDLTKTVIHSANNLEELKSVARIAINHNADMGTIQMKLIHVCLKYSHLILFLLGCMFICYSALSFRAKELALEAAEKSKVDSPPEEA
jgi:Na+-transporting methylmalonyl-CoA/oxaloacetate decarboxylase gamma subunit